MAERQYTGDLVEAYVKMRKAEERAKSAEKQLKFLITHYAGQFDLAEYVRQTTQWEADYEAGRVRFSGAPARPHVG